MVAGEVHPRPGHQRGEVRQKIQRLEHNVCGAVAVGAFEPFVVNVRAGDAAAQAFEFLALMGASRESNYLANGRFGHVAAFYNPRARLTASRTKADIWANMNLSLLVRSAHCYHPSYVVTNPFAVRNLAVVCAVSETNLPVLFVRSIF